MVLKSILGPQLSKESINFLRQFVNEQLELVKDYMREYTRKLQLIAAFDKDWGRGELKRLREVMGAIMHIDISEQNIVSGEEKSIQRVASEIIQILEKEINSQKNTLERKVVDDLTSLLRKLKIFEKNLSLQRKWFITNKTEGTQNANKEQLVNLVRRESATLFDIESTDIKDLIVKVNELLQTYELSIIQEDTYIACEAELHREIQEFNKDRLDLSVEKTVKLGGGFKNPVLLVETSSDCRYVAKAFTEKGAFKESMRAWKFIKAAGGLVPDIIKVSKNEIICKEVRGTIIRKILISEPHQAGIAFFTLGKSLATIHKNTLNQLSSYDPRVIFRSGFTKDYVKLKEHMRLILSWGMINEDTYKSFLNIRKRYKQTNLSAIIHGDAHLDNFFFVTNPETIILIDYDDAHVGDPLADVGRVVASIRNWQYKARLDEAYAEQVIQMFFRGYNSILNIELRGTNLYTLRLYLVIIKSSKRLIDKINEIINNDGNFRANYGVNPVQFFNSKFKTATAYFHADEIEKLLEIRFCLQQINKFVSGKDVDLNECLLSRAA